MSLFNSLAAGSIFKQRTIAMVLLVPAILNCCKCGKLQATLASII